MAYVYTLLSRAPVTEDPFAEGAFPDADAVLHVRHRGRIRVRVDGQVVLEAEPPTPGEWGLASAPFLMTRAYDVFLVKSGRGSEELGDSMDFELRVSDPSGAALPGQTWNTMRPPGKPSDLQ